LARGTAGSFESGTLSGDTGGVGGTEEDTGGGGATAIEAAAEALATGAFAGAEVVPAAWTTGTLAAVITALSFSAASGSKRTAISMLVQRAIALRSRE
jgi:hypothetical protein